MASRIHVNPTDAGSDSSEALKTEAPEAPGDADAYALLYSEAVRNLSAQEGALDELRNRAGMMLSAAGVVAAFLGSASLTAAADLSTKPSPIGGVSGPADMRMVVAIYMAIGLAALLTVVAACLFINILPARTWKFRVGTKDLLAQYIECERPASLPVMHRSLAWYLDDSEKSNEKALNRLYGRFAIGAATFVVSLLAWLIALGGTVAVRLMS